ncbi:MAG: malate synthase A [Hyphomicrobiales bacterium]|nr:malate synthase A [Hyphomicrobiales bacterium]
MDEARLNASEASPGVEINGAMKPGFERVLTPAAMAFIAGLARKFEGRRRELLARREARQAEFDAGALPDFLPETAAIREGDWLVRGIPADIQDRRVEITGPTTRKMIINALNSGAKVFMADFEDATSPTWDNVIEGQLNFIEYWQGRLDFSENGKDYKVGANPAVLMIRPRGWHLLEEHIRIDGEPLAGAFADFGFYMHHNAKNVLAKGKGLYFYLPKMESHLEARLWNDVFVYAQSVLGVPIGTVKATMLIETLPAVFEMHEILYELRDHAVGLNCGRWDYMFSFIKTLRAKPEFLLPDRGQLTMDKAFLKAYSELLIKTCHKRAAFAMGGMAAFIPNRKDAEVTEKAIAAVRADKTREVEYGHDGTWVAHPDLVPVALEIFNAQMPQPNQLRQPRDDVNASQRELLEVHHGARTEEGMRVNIRVGVQYIEAWLRGMGAVPLYNLMEDAATAEISRTQVWQWVKYGARLTDGRVVTRALFEELLQDEMNKLHASLGCSTFHGGRFDEAIAIFHELIMADKLESFLTLPAYRRIV